MPNAAASRRKAQPSTLKYQITGSALLLAVVGIVLFAVMQPPGDLMPEQAQTRDDPAVADSSQPRPELVAVAVQSQQLLDSIRNYETFAAVESESQASDPVPQVAEQVAVEEPQPVETPKPEKPAVEIAIAEVVSDPSDEPEPVQHEVSGINPSDSWFLQIGAFKSPSNAELLGLEARNVGYSTEMKEVGTGTDAVIKLLIGPYATQNDALAVKSKLEGSEFIKKNNIDGMFVVHAGSQS